MADQNNGFVNWNQLYSQMQPGPSLVDMLNGSLLGGYQNFGNQMQNAMSQFGNVAALNSANNKALNNANAQYYTGYQAPVDQMRLQQEGQANIERMRQEGMQNRLQTLSPLLTGLFNGNSGGSTGSAGGGGFAGLTGFNAVGPDGKTVASASLGGGGGGGSTGGQLGQAQPGNASTAQPTNVAKYTPSRNSPTSPDYYKGLAGGYGQPVSPADTAAALLRFKQTGHYSPTPYAQLPY